VLISKLPPGQNYSSYLAASYVQWVQAGGARAVPIIIGKDEQYYRELFSSLNGVLLPGGSAPLTGGGGYAEVGELFYHLAKEANDAGDSFPIWGTCNGFELLTVLSSKDHSRLTDCDSQDDAVPLNFLPAWEDSDLFSSVRTSQGFP
jgi:gamma-glutamyl hydrolase